MFDVFPNRKGPFDDTRSYFQKSRALSFFFYSKTLILAFLFKKRLKLVKENDFLTLWNFTYLKDTSLGKNWCNFEHGLETKNEFEKWPHNFFSV